MEWLRIPDESQAGVLPLGRDWSLAKARTPFIPTFVGTPSIDIVIILHSTKKGKKKKPLDFVHSNSQRGVLLTG